MIDLATLSKINALVRERETLLLQRTSVQKSNLEELGFKFEYVRDTDKPVRGPRDFEITLGRNSLACSQMLEVIVRHLDDKIKIVEADLREIGVDPGKE